MSLIVFTDLDGSLLDHETYSIEPARGVLMELANRKIPLIINSSKTATEIEAIRTSLRLQSPFICENGAALYRDNEEVVEFGIPRRAWLADVHELRNQHSFSFEGFDDWSDSEVSSHTGLSLTQAAQAKTRNYSEPILWRDSESALLLFHKQLDVLGLRALHGGRFLSIQSLYDKSDAMHWMVNNETAFRPSEKPLVVALGDSPNDSAMLDGADIAVIIKSTNSSLIHCPNPRRLFHTTQTGPSGWGEAMRTILSLYDSDQLLRA